MIVFSLTGRGCLVPVYRFSTLQLLGNFCIASLLEHIPAIPAAKYPVFDFVNYKIPIFITLNDTAFILGPSLDDIKATVVSGAISPPNSYLHSSGEEHLHID